MTETSGPNEILATRLYAPPTRSEFVPRTRLLTRLNEGMYRKLTLVSAPAGFGKTMLVSDWLRHSQRPVAWLSLNEVDNDLTCFLAGLIAAIQTISPALGKIALSRLQSPQPPATNTILTSLLNEITTTNDHLALVLDDYHVIDNVAVHEALAFLLAHLPPQMHLALATREDPPLPLARLRVRDQLTELRAADLRFTPDEVATFLNQVMGLQLSTTQVTALESRTEGWIAGLQLAALSMQGRSDTNDFIQNFAGDHRYIVDYLLEEVLEQQPPAIRAFLLQTSILDRLSGPLCDAVTCQQDGVARLEALERGNLFVVPLDEKRHWFRYHHLFADVLQAHARKQDPTQIPRQHQRASLWYESNGLPADAIRHALAAQDFERAASLVEQEWPAMDGRFQSATWLGWARALPDQLFYNRPVLSVALAWAYINQGDLEAGKPHLHNATQWLEMTESERKSSTEMVITDQEQLRFLQPSISTAWAYCAQAQGDGDATVKHAQQALSLLPKTEYIRRGPAAALLGLSHWANGDLELAHQLLDDAMTDFRQAGQLQFAISGTYGLADICITQGQLHKAIQHYQHSLQLIEAQGDNTLCGIADMHLGLGDLYHQQGDIEASRHHLAQNESLGEHAALPDWPYRFAYTQARIKESEGDLDAALAMLDQAEQLYFRGPVPNVYPIATSKARIWIRQGNLPKARQWAHEQQLFTYDELSFLQESSHLTLARLRIAESQQERTEHAILEAASLLDRLLAAAEATRRTGSVLEILMLQTLAYQAQGHTTQAITILERTLTIAQPEGYVRLFLNEKDQIATLLPQIKPQNPSMQMYLHTLHTAFGHTPTQPQDKAPSPAQQGPAKTPHGALLEPLSEREQEVLQLIAQGLSNQEISQRLHLALSTIKGHNRNIFGKLDVKRRTEAVACARKWGLI